MLVKLAFTKQIYFYFHNVFARPTMTLVHVLIPHVVTELYLILCTSVSIIAQYYTIYVTRKARIENTFYQFDVV